MNPAKGSRPDVQFIGSSAATKQMIAVLREIEDEGRDAARRSWPDARSPAYDFDLAVLERGINAVNGIRILVENGHWELAQGVLRQLFELLINIDYLYHQPDRAEAMWRYTKFGILEKLEARRDEMVYDRDAGHPVDLARLEALKEYLAGPSFDEFKDKNGGPVKYWSRKNVWALCAASSMEMRMHQYRLLYSAWSEHAHATPGALVDAILGRQGAEWAQEVLASDEAETAECIRMAVAFFVELRMYLPAIGAVDGDVAYDWLERVKTAELRAG